MSQETFPHSTSLQAAAPGLRGSFSRIFNTSELHQYEQLYAACVALGASSEGSTRRGAEEAFNPKPARISKILLRECKEEELSVHLLAQICCLPARAFLKLSSKIRLEPHVLKIARLVYFSSLPEHVCQVSERISLALLLDGLRHLHMSKSGSEQQAVVLQEAVRRLAWLPGHASNDRLFTVTRATIERTAIRLEREYLVETSVEKLNANAA